MKIVLTILQMAALYLCGLVLLNMNIESKAGIPHELCVDAGASSESD